MCKADGLVELLLPTWNDVCAHVSLLWLSWPTFESAPGESGLYVYIPDDFTGLVSMICHVSDLAQSMQAVLPRGIWALWPRLECMMIHMLAEVMTLISMKMTMLRWYLVVLMITVC